MITLLTGCLFKLESKKREIVYTPRIGKALGGGGEKKKERREECASEKGIYSVLHANMPPCDVIPFFVFIHLQTSTQNVTLT